MPRQLSHAFPLPKEVWVAQAWPPGPTTGEALQSLVPLLSQEEHLLGKKPKSLRGRDFGLNPWLVNNLTICLIPL